MGIRLSQDEAWAVIDEAHTGILTTLKADGSPVTLPMWFVVVDRTVCFTTFERTKKLARIRRDPRASFLVESGQRWVDLCAVHLTGRIEEVTDDAARSRIDAALVEKYASFRVDRSTMPDTTRDAYTDKRLLRLVPDDRILSWDNSRIGLKGSS